MAIYNLSGNFQPPTVDTGKSLPFSSSSRATSTISEYGAPSVVENGSSVVKKTETIITDINRSDSTQSKTPLEKEVKTDAGIEEFQNFNQSINRSLQFKVDEELGVTIVRVFDRNTDELIRQFPPEELLNLSRRLKDLNEENSGSSGVLLQEKV